MNRCNLRDPNVFLFVFRFACCLLRFLNLISKMYIINRIYRLIKSSNYYCFFLYLILIRRRYYIQVVVYIILLDL